MKNGDQVRVNVRTKVNNASIRKETRNGREVIVVPSATMPDDIVMNGVKYPADEIDSSFRTLNQSPAPLGHPTDQDGNFVSARDGDGLNGFYFGAFNANARRENGRVFVDKIIDVEMAKALPNGQEVLNAIEAGNPIHTSTGLFCNLEDAGDNDGCKFLASGIIFDHDAILLDEQGAATPEQGVGMMVNHALAQNGDKLMVINSDVSDRLDSEIDYYGMELVRAVQRKKDATTWERLKSAILGALSGEDQRETETNSNKDDDMTDVTKEMFDKLSGLVNELVEKIDGLDVDGKVGEAVEPLQNQLSSISKAQTAEADAKHKSLVERVVNQNLLSEDAAKETPAAALEALIGNAAGHQAAPILGGFSNSQKPTYELPEE